MLPSSPLLARPVGSHVAIVSGSFGAGHDAVATEIAAHLEAAGAFVTTYDIAALMPIGLGRLLKRAYYAQLRWAPATWGTTLGYVGPDRPLLRLAVRVLGLADERVVSAVTGSDLVVVTHPFAAQALGVARRRGLLSAPVVTYLTDPSVHALWVHPAVDLHLAIHEVAAEQARRLGGRTVTVEPVVRKARRTGVDPLAAYEIQGPRALVTGGSLGIGELEQTARDILRTGVMTPVVACGTNSVLRERVERIGGAVGLGWREDLPDVIAACDCVVQNAGGFTSLEALAAGTPVLTYRAIPGHGVTNAENLARAGLAPWPRSVPALRRTLLHARDLPRRDRIPHDAPSVLDVLTCVTSGRRALLSDEVA